MQFTLALASLASLAAAAPASLASFAAAVLHADRIVARAPDNTQAILQNITQIRTDIKTLNNTINEQSDPTAQYNFYQLIAIQGESDTVSTDLNSTAATANASAVATASESQQVYNAVNDGLRPDTISLLDNLIYHYPGLKSGGISGTVENNLVSQRELTRELGNALVAKADASYVGPAGNVNSEILSKFNEAIAKFTN